VHGVNLGGTLTLAGVVAGIKLAQPHGAGTILARPDHVTGDGSALANHGGAEKAKKLKGASDE
jgi:hypothetical protein